MQSDASVLYQSQAEKSIKVSDVISPNGDCGKQNNGLSKNAQIPTLRP